MKIIIYDVEKPFILNKRYFLRHSDFQVISRQTSGIYEPKTSQSRTGNDGDLDQQKRCNRLNQTNFGNLTPNLDRSLSGGL